MKNRIGKKTNRRRYLRDGTKTTLANAAARKARSDQRYAVLSALEQQTRRAKENLEKENLEEVVNALREQVARQEKFASPLDGINVTPGKYPMDSGWVEPGELRSERARARHEAWARHEDLEQSKAVDTSDDDDEHVHVNVASRERIKARLAGTPAAKKRREAPERRKGEVTPDPFVRTIKGVEVSVFDVIEAFGVDSPLQHVVKAMLCPGIYRHQKPTPRQLEEAIALLWHVWELKIS